MRASYTVIILCALLLFASCKKENNQSDVYFNALTNGFSKDWRHYQVKAGAGNIRAVDSCGIDDSWRFSIDKTISIDTKNTHCPGTDTAQFVSLHWDITSNGDSMKWQALSNGGTVNFAFKIVQLTDSLMILDNRADSLDNSGVSHGIVDYLDYFKKW